MTMPEYIEREAALIGIMNDGCTASNIAVLMDIPAADVVLAQRWIPVTERLPETMQPVIVCRECGKVEQGYKDVGDWWKVYGTRTKHVTHWMPLPQPPEEG